MIRRPIATPFAMTLVLTLALMQSPGAIRTANAQQETFADCVTPPAPGAGGLDPQIRNCWEITGKCVAHLEEEVHAERTVWWFLIFFHESVDITVVQKTVLQCDGAFRVASVYYGGSFIRGVTTVLEKTGTKGGDGEPETEVTTEPQSVCEYKVFPDSCVTPEISGMLQLSAVFPGKLVGREQVCIPSIKADAIYTGQPPFVTGYTAKSQAEAPCMWLDVEWR